MSLTQQMHGGTVERWCRLRLPGTSDVVAELQAELRTTPPVRPTVRAVGDHWATVGGMVGARLALWVEHAPPYPALYGMVRAGLVSRAWAQRQAGLFPTHAGRRLDVEARGLELRPAPVGWIDTGYIRDEEGPLGPAEDVLGELLAGFRAFAAQRAAPGVIGPDDAESVLARVLWALNGLEDAYRGGRLPAVLAAVFSRASVTVSDLVDACPGDQVAEHLAILARGRGQGLEQMRSLARPGPGGALGHSDPVFIPHWADGDILLTAEESTLVDVKTVLRVDDVERVARWLWQILAYAAIDTTDPWKKHGRADRWRIGRVGLYLARHGVLVSWPVDELWGRLLGTEHPVEISNARRELRAEVEIAAASEGARLLWPTQ